MKSRHLVLVLPSVMLALVGCTAPQADEFTLIERQITLRNGKTITCVLVDETSSEDTYVDIAGITCNF